MTEKQLAIWHFMEVRLAVYLRSFAGLMQEDREDCLQIALIAFWRSGLDDVKDARPWLYQVIRNAAIDLLRKRSRYPTLMPDPDKTAAWDYAPEELAMSREEAEFMGHFINNLTMLPLQRNLSLG